jgi:hypothetical protein
LWSPELELERRLRSGVIGQQRLHVGAPRERPFAQRSGRNVRCNRKRPVEGVERDAHACQRVQRNADRLREARRRQGAVALGIPEREACAVAREALAPEVERGRRARLEAALDEAHERFAALQLFAGEREPPLGRPLRKQRVAHARTHLPGRTCKVLACRVREMTGLRFALLPRAEGLDDEVDHQADGPRRGHRRRAVVAESEAGRRVRRLPGGDDAGARGGEAGAGDVEVGVVVQCREAQRVESPRLGPRRLARERKARRDEPVQTRVVERARIERARARGGGYRLRLVGSAARERCERECEARAAAVDRLHADLLSWKLSEIRTAASAHGPAFQDSALPIGGRSMRGGIR